MPLNYKIINLPILEGIDELEDNSLNCIITSPPYWGLRDYGQETNTTIWDNDTPCDHSWDIEYNMKNGGASKDDNPPAVGSNIVQSKSALRNEGVKSQFCSNCLECKVPHDWGNMQKPIRSRWGDVNTLSEKQSSNRGSKQNVSALETPTGQFCRRCSAWKGQLGLEPTFELFISHLVQIFNKLRTKLRKDGTLWVNLGDTYSGSMLGAGKDGKIYKGNSLDNPQHEKFANKGGSVQGKIKNVKPKSQIGIPERFKIAMIDNGWICRNTIIWHKPNPMPSSVKDRYTNDYEYFYFFSKSNKYYFKQQFEPLSEASVEDLKRRTNMNFYLEEGTTSKYSGKKLKGSKDGRRRDEFYDLEKGRNKRTVWEADEVYIDSKYENVEQETSVRQGMNKERGNNIIRKRNLPPQKEFVEQIREWISNDKESVSRSIEALAAHTQIPLSTVQHWFRKDESGFAFPSIEDWEKVESIYKTKSLGYDFDYLIEYTEELDEIKNTTPDSRNKRTTWKVNVASFSDAHFAVYPRQLIESPIDACVPKKICLECDKPMDITECDCNAGHRKGVVLDPFCGSGTTIIEALMQEKDGIGIEINPEYVEIAKKRIDKEIPTLSPLDDWM
jgi:DNA modification methylase